MINKTSLLAVRTLIHLSRDRDHAVRSPRQLAETLRESPTYLAKVTGLLVKAGMLRAEKGARGGVYLSKAPADITLLQVVEACQGSIVGDYCRPDCDKRIVCSYHLAADELRTAIVKVLDAWTIERLSTRASSSKVGDIGGIVCLMAGGQPAAIQ